MLTSTRESSDEAERSANASALDHHAVPAAGLSTQQALKLHREFLQEILAEVLSVFASGVASEERLVSALGVYWEACLARRDTRRAVIIATAGNDSEGAVEPMGKPFLMMVRAELLPRHGRLADSLALRVYDEARAIAVDEASTGGREEARRAALVALIRAA